MKKYFDAEHLRKLFAFYWIHGVLLAVEIAFVFWILRKGFLFRGYVQVEQGKSWWTLLGPYAAPVAGLFGGSVALWTYNRSHKQKQEHFDRQSLDAQFTDILNRLSNKDSAAIRANAALRLAEMARQQAPGKNKGITPESYPFFERASSQLATMLHMEDEQVVRDEVIKAIGKMAEFAEKGNQHLLHILIANLADANRSAKKAFIDALAQFTYFTNHEADYLQELSGIARLSISHSATLLCLESLIQEDECLNAAVYYGTLRNAQSQEVAHEHEKEVHINIRSRSAKLVDTRNALVIALRSLSIPSDVPEDLTQLRNWRRTFPIDLNSCFLAGVNLLNVHLPGADMNYTHLQGSRFDGADLRGARLVRAQAQNTKFMSQELKKGSKLQGARLEHAYLSVSTFLHADMTGTILFAAHLQDAFVGSCILKEAYISNAELQRTSFAGSILTNAMIGGAIVVEGVNENSISQLWCNTNVEEADFHNAPPHAGGILDNELLDKFHRAFLNKAFHNVEMKEVEERKVSSNAEVYRQETEASNVPIELGHKPGA